MNQNKKGNGWVLCSSKSFPGKFYYFNVLNGETAWTLTETEVEKTKKQVYSNYPKPLTKPPEDSSVHTTTDSHPKTPVTAPGSLQPEPSLGDAVFPVFLSTKDLPKYVWALVPIKYVNKGNNPSLEVQKSHTHLIEVSNKNHQSMDDIDHISIQVHTCNDQYVSKRFVTFSNTLNSNEYNQFKNANEHPFGMSAPIEKPVQPKSSFPFNENTFQFQNDIPNTFQFTKTIENNKNKYNNTNYIFQSTNNNSENEETTFNSQQPTNDGNTFRDVFDTAKKTTYKFKTPNNISYGFDTPKETTPGLGVPGFGFNTLNETSYKSNAPNKINLCSPDTPKNTQNTYDFDISEKAIHGLNTQKNTIFEIDTPYKTISGLDTPKKTISEFDTPNKTISQEIQAKISGQLPENDLRNILLKRKRKIENSINNYENAKTEKIITSFSEKQASPKKKRVTFKLDASDIESSEDFSYINDQVLASPPSLAVQSISSLRRLGGMDGTWCIAIDLDILLENFDCIDAFVRTDPQCRLIVPYSVYKELKTTGTAHGERKRVNAARVVLRRLECHYPRHRVQHEVNELEKLKSQKDQIQSCCLEFIRNKIHVVLITNDNILYKEAKEKGIHVFKMIQIQNGEPKNAAVTFDIRKIKIQIPNDNRVPNSKENNVGNPKTLTGNGQNVANENHEQKTDEKYKNSVQNFWCSNNSDSCDLNIVNQQIKKLDLTVKPCPFEPKNTQLTPKKQIQKEETITSSFFKKTVQNDLFKKPLTNVVTTKNVIQNGSATKESQIDNEKEKLFHIFVNSGSKKTENEENNNKYSISKKTIQNPFTNFSITKNVTQNGSATKQSQIDDQNDSKETDNQKNDDHYSVSKTIDSKETDSWKSDCIQENRVSVFKNPASKESEHNRNDNQYYIFKHKVSKKTEKHGNENQNSIFEIDSNFMPITSRTIEDYLKMFSIKNKTVEDTLKNSCEERMCCLRQILENLADALQISSSKTDDARACVLFNILQNIRKTYGKHKLIREVIERLQILLYRSGCIGKVRCDLLPIEIMQAIGCGVLLVKLLQELIPSSEHLADVEEGLNDLIKSIENPITVDFDGFQRPITYRSEEMDEIRCSFKPQESHIIEYLKKHYSAWTQFNETTSNVKQNHEIKIFRTFGKNLKQFKLNRSKNINIVNTVSKNEEKHEIPNSKDQKEKNAAFSTFFENVDKEKELKDLNSYKAGENINVDGKKTYFDLKKIFIDLKSIEIKNREKAEPTIGVKVFSNYKRGENTDFDLKETEQENTFGTTESGPKVIRNIALIPKYEDLLKRSSQNGTVMQKAIQNGLQNSGSSLSDTENLVNENLFLKKSIYKTNHESKSTISINNTENFENECSSVLENISSVESSIKDYTVSDRTSSDMKDSSDGIQSLIVNITLVLFEVKTCFNNILNDFIIKNNKEPGNNIKTKSVEKTARKLRLHVVRINEKLSLHCKANDKNSFFSVFDLLMKSGKGKSNESFISRSRLMIFVLMKQAKNLNKMLFYLGNRQQENS